MSDKESEEDAFTAGTHFLTLRTDSAIQAIRSWRPFIAKMAKECYAIDQEDAVLAKDVLTDQGLRWGPDFDIQRV